MSNYLGGSYGSGGLNSSPPVSISGDGSSITIQVGSESSTIPAATTTAAGVMTASDKTAFDNLQTDLIQAQAEVTAAQSAADQAQAEVDAAETRLDVIEANLASKLESVNLSSISDLDSVIITNDAGDDAVIAEATESAAGVMSRDDKEKLNDLPDTPNSGIYRLVSDGEVFTLEQMLEFSQRNINPLMNQSDTFETYDVMPFVMPINDIMYLKFGVTWSTNVTSVNIFVELVLDADTVDEVVVAKLIKESKDSAGIGLLDVPIVGGGTIDSGTDIRYPDGMEDFMPVSAGAHTLSIRWRGQNNGTRATIYKSFMSAKNTP